MPNKLQPKILIALLVLLATFTLLSCTSEANTKLPVVADYELPEISEKKVLRLGVVPGPYAEMFTRAILPYLDKLGYQVEIIYYDDYIAPNFALDQFEIDLNMFQHYIYMNDFKFINDLTISAITEIPTASMGIFSTRLTALNEVSSNISVAIPDDSTNLARALIVLEDAQLIRLNPLIEKSKATLTDIIDNPHNIHINLIKAHELVDKLDDFDLSVINGNFAISGGLDLSDALFNEVLEANYLNVIAVRTEDLAKQFVRDIISAVNSEHYRKIISDPNGKYVNFQLPLALKKDKNFEGP